jgi:hypothetical protein
METAVQNTFFFRTKLYTKLKESEKILFENREYEVKKKTPKSYHSQISSYQKNLEL